jgi:hypothetical protein
MWDLKGEFSRSKDGEESFLKEITWNESGFLASLSSVGPDNTLGVGQ